MSDNLCVLSLNTGSNSLERRVSQSYLFFLHLLKIQGALKMLRRPEVICYAKVNRKCRVKIFETTLRYQENQ